MNQTTRYKIKLVRNIAILYCLIGLFFGFFDSIIYNINSNTFELMVLDNHPLHEHLMMSALGPGIGGILGGYFLVFVVREKFRSLSYGKQLFVNSIFYFLIIGVVMIVVSFVTVSDIQNKNILDPQVQSQVYLNLSGPGSIKYVITWYLVITLTLIGLQVNDKFGPGVFIDLLKGKYHNPRPEYRIFMFLDLNRSTSIAEKMGHAAYFKFLQYFFDMITEPITNSLGEIYQYVGDEIVVSWSLEKGRNNANALNCYFNIGVLIDKHEQEFKSQFNLMPEFRSAIHAGEVTVGEIGKVKRDIIYTGDVLNTTARLLELGKSKEISILVSGEVKMQFESEKKFLFQQIGSLSLRGKEAKVDAYALTRL